MLDIGRSVPPGKVFSAVRIEMIKLMLIVQGMGQVKYALGK
jgi:hypothetical protein